MPRINCTQNTSYAREHAAKILELRAQGMTLTDIAARFDVSSGTIREILSETRQRMAETKRRVVIGHAIE